MDEIEKCSERTWLLSGRQAEQAIEGFVEIEQVGTKVPAKRASARGCQRSRESLRAFSQRARKYFGSRAQFAFALLGVAPDSRHLYVNVYACQQLPPAEWLHEKIVRSSMESFNSRLFACSRR